MLTKLAIFTFLLFIFPVRPYAQPDKAKEESSNQGSAAPTLPASTQKADSPALQPEHKEPIDADVRVISAPEKDGYDYAAFWVNFALAVIGASGIVVACITLCKLERQTKATEDQVKASHDGLRAWIGIDVHENELPTALAVSMIDQINNVLIPTPPRFIWEIKNYGQTPAFIQKMGSNHTYADTASLDTMPSPAMHPMVAFIGAGREKVNILTIEPEVLRKVEARTKFWRVAIKLEYLDAFDKRKIHETMVSFHYYVPKNEKDPIKRGFYQEIDPSTNYNT